MPGPASIDVLSCVEYNLVLKVVSNENGGGSGMRQMIGIGLRPW